MGAAKSQRRRECPPFYRPASQERSFDVLKATLPTLTKRRTLLKAHCQVKSGFSFTFLLSSTHRMFRTVEHPLHIIINSGRSNHISRWSLPPVAKQGEGVGIKSIINANVLN